MINQLGDSFELVMTSYFEDFKNSMKERLRIPKSLVEARAVKEGHSLGLYVKSWKRHV